MTIVLFQVSALCMLSSCCVLAIEGLHKKCCLRCHLWVAATTKIHVLFFSEHGAHNADGRVAEV